MKTKLNEKETRSYQGEVRTVTEDNGQATITGYASVFNSLSENLGGFRETIEPSAFDEVLTQDVRALFNHDPNFVLGRTASNTLKLSVDENGLKYEITPPNTQTIRDLVLEPLKRGDISQSSFGFTVDEDDWQEDTEGRVIRTVKKVRQLFDISPVTYPAYTDTTSSQRALDNAKAQFENQKEQEQQQTTLELEERERTLTLLNIVKLTQGN